MTNFLSQRLRAARERLSLTQQQVADRAVEVGASSLSEFESGKREPSLVQLQALAVVYRRSLAWLLEDSPPEDAQVVLWRMRPDPTVAADIEAQFLRLCEQYRNLELWTGEMSECDLPRVKASATSFGYADAEALAHTVRASLNLGSYPGPSLFHVLQHVCHVKIFHLDTMPGGTAASCKTSEFGAAVLLNSKNVRWRRIFDCAHEMFHLLTWETFKATWSGVPKTATLDEERFATCFARYLLMPPDPFLLEVDQRMKGKKSLDPADYFSLANRFEVSPESAIRHHAYLTKQGDDVIAGHLERFSAQRLQMPRRENDSPPRRPERFQDLALMALRRGEMSIGRYAEYTAVPRAEALRIAERSPDAIEEDSASPA